MYELKNGSARLVSALERFGEDPRAIQYIAQALNYDRAQLGQDIRALVDRFGQDQTAAQEAGQIRYSPEKDAYTLLGERLHCGQRLEVLTCPDGSPAWSAARFELNGENQPYLPGFRGVAVLGLFARFPEDL